MSNPSRRGFTGLTAVVYYFKRFFRTRWHVSVFFLTWQFSHLYSVCQEMFLTSNTCMRCHRDLKRVFVLLQRWWVTLRLATPLTCTFEFRVWFPVEGTTTASDESSNQTHISSRQFGPPQHHEPSGKMLCTLFVLFLFDVFMPTTEYSATVKAHIFFLPQGESQLTSIFWYVVHQYFTATA